MPSQPIEIHADISRASTMPADVYHAREFYDLQKDRVFARTWQVVSDAARARAPGHVLPFTLLEGCLDEPLVFTRDGAGSPHCLSNVCTHRGALVVEGEGHLKTLRCRYHGRRFALDGTFTSMPEFEGVHGFPSARDNLPKLPLHQWGPLSFTAIDPAMSFDDWMKPVRDRTDWMPIDGFVRDAATSRDYVVNSNWALYVDNYSEEFHIPYVHAGLSDQLDYSAYRTELFDYGSLQLGIAKPGETVFELPAGHPEQGQQLAALYFWLFPNLMLNFYPWGLSANIVQPLSESRTKVSFVSYVWRDDLRDKGVGAGLHLVEMEDEEVVESVQAGVRSRLYDRGRYSPKRETGTHHFHRLLARFMSEGK